MTATLFSFDVFDTALTRSYAAPADLYLHLSELVAERGWIADAESFARARAEAETRAWRVVGHTGAISIELIYQCLAPLVGWPESLADQAMHQEVELEFSAVRAVPDTLALVKRLRSTKTSIVFISDMHLRQHHVRSMLDRSGFVEAGDFVFVSSDCGVSKRSRGRLYRHVLGALGVSRFKFRHVGDDLRADVLMAAMNGIRARLFSRVRMNRFESIMLQHLPASDWRARTAASASRQARLSRGKATDSQDTWDLLCSTIAPFVTGYAFWLLAEARRRGVETLYFLARDMQIVHEVADLLAERSGAGVRCAYIHASRAAWQRPGYSGDMTYDVFWLVDQLGGGAAKAALARLLPASAIDQLDQAGVLGAHPREDVATTLKRWLQTPAVAAAVSEAVATDRALLHRYLESRGYAADQRCALVDAGWRGTLQKCLARTYALGGRPARIEGYYIGLRHRFAAEPGTSMHAFLPDEEVGRLGYALVSLVEAFLAADHGTTLGYSESEQDGQVIPVLGPPPSQVLLRQWQLVRESCVAYAEAFASAPVFRANHDSIPHVLALPLLHLCRQPARADTAALRGWSLDVGRSESEVNLIASPLTLADFVKILRAGLLGTQEADVYLSSPWLRGAITASPVPVRWLAKALLARGSPGDALREPRREVSQN